MAKDPEGYSNELAVCIEQARKLIDQKHAIQAILQERRILANLLVNTGVGSEEQREWVAEYLPRKKRRTTAELEPEFEDDIPEEALAEAV
ncbi:MAG: hypothetical protein ABSF18_07735 [Gammaproteobacteria bacterium]